MARCEICESDTQVRKVNLEGGTVEACFYCVPPTRFSRSSEFKKKKRFENIQPQVSRVLVDDYASRIKHSREQKNMTQKELANKVEEHESVLIKIEQGKFRPNLAVARKIETLFNITLIKSVEPVKNAAESSPEANKNKLENIIHTEKRRNQNGFNSNKCTIADYIKIKK